ncbi:MAG: lysylphosphatidylglycerol synthase transmembrane domain-containing protein, partial [Thermomicrobiales bacterium]
MSLRRLGMGAVLASVVLTTLVLAGDARDVTSALGRFNWWLAPPIVALTLWNYGWRFVKWEMYLRYLSVPRLPIPTSLLVFISGFSMSLTPGKVGEIIKSVYLRRLTGAPVNRTSAIIAAERMTDALALLLLAAMGLISFTYGRPFLAALGLLCILVLIALQRPASLSRWLVRIERLPAVGRIVEHGIAFVGASSLLFSPRPLSRAIGLGLISWVG